MSSTTRATITQDSRRAEGYFLTIGPFASRKTAEAARAKIEAAGVKLEEPAPRRFASPDLLRIVQRTYRDSGRSFRATARQLNAAGVLTPRGKVGGWQATTVRRVLEGPGAR